MYLLSAGRLKKEKKIICFSGYKDLGSNPTFTSDWVHDNKVAYFTLLSLSFLVCKREVIVLTSGRACEDEMR